MEAGGEIPLGSTKKLRKASRVLARAEQKSIFQLVNAARHVCPVDFFMPDLQQPLGDGEPDALQKKPVLIATADQERKQRHICVSFIRCCKFSKLPVPVRKLLLFLTQGQWEHALAYRHRLRMMIRRCEHHRLQNDWQFAPKQEQLWGLRSFLCGSRHARVCAMRHRVSRSGCLRPTGCLCNEETFRYL